MKHFEVIVIGGGHAGIEASLAAARMGLETALITMDSGKIGEMSCNPSIGGVGKGQLTREIDALGGEMGKNADYTGIQFKRLNTRKGSAVQSSRCQSDKNEYAKRMQKVVRDQERLTIVEGEVKSLVVEDGRVGGVEVTYREGSLVSLSSRQVVITSGTFMRGLMHCGDQKSQGGRFGESPALGLSDQLRELGFSILRLKTGTPPRLIRESIDFSAMAIQPGDDRPKRFSFSDTEIKLPQVSCYLTFTNERTHEEIRKSLDRSPLYSGQIKGVGPRYCPSIEDKVVKFPQKTRHQLFFEPEALDSNWILPEWNFDESSARRAGGVCSYGSRLRGGSHCSVWVRGRVRLRGAEPAQTQFGDQTNRRSLLGWSSEWNVRVRRSGGSGSYRRDQCRSESPGSRAPDFGSIGSLYWGPYRRFDRSWY